MNQDELPMSEQKNVPYADLYAQYLSIREEIDGAIDQVIRESSFIRGPHVDCFEEEFAAAIGADHCVSCANGTDALYIAMNALGLSVGDEVITTAHSWISTSEAISQAGGRVVFCDTDRETFTLDASKLEAIVTPRTVGIIPVHLAGQPADMDAITAFARRHGLWIIEDCAQAHLATYKGRIVGSFGVAATFSFYPGKNLGAMGDAGAIVTGDASLASRMAMFARHGGLKKGEHKIEGINSRLDGLQAAILSVKLRHLSRWTQIRRDIASRYTAALRQLDGVYVPSVRVGCEHVFHLYMIRHAQRDSLASYLRARGIQTAINYPIALPFLPAYRRLGHTPSHFPNAFANQSTILSLPIFAEMSNEQLAHVVNSVGEFVAQTR